MECVNRISMVSSQVPMPCLHLDRDQSFSSGFSRAHLRIVPRLTHSRTWDFEFRKAPCQILTIWTIFSRPYFRHSQSFWACVPWGKITMITSNRSRGSLRRWMPGPRKEIASSLGSLDCFTLDASRSRARSMPSRASWLRRLRWRPCQRDVAACRAMEARSRMDRRSALAGPPRFPPRRPRATAWGFFFMGDEDIMRSSMVKRFLAQARGEGLGPDRGDGGRDGSRDGLNGHYQVL